MVIKNRATKSLKAREKFFLAAAAAAVVLFIVGRLLMAQVNTYRANQRELLPEKLALLSDYRAAVAREKVLVQENRELDQVLESYEKYLLPSSEPSLAAAELQTHLKDLAGRAGLKIVSEKILTHRKEEHYLEIPVQIVASGGLENLRDFIVSLERAEVFIAIRKMNLRAVKKKQFLPATRTYAEKSEIQATLTVAGLIHG